MSPTPIRDAATIILIRNPHNDPEVLLGKRQRNAVFMPDRYVFPGGAVDAADEHVPVTGQLHPACTERLSGGHHTAHAYPVAAIRELWEETGLRYANTEPFLSPAGWEEFSSGGVGPTLDGLTLVFRATTPAGRPRRFDARFFVADAKGLYGPDDDFSGASGELSDLAWHRVDQLGALNIAPVTQAALRTAFAQLPDLAPPTELVHRRDPASEDGPRDPSG